MEDAMSTPGDLLASLEQEVVYHEHPFEWFSWRRVFSSVDVGRALRAEMPAAGFDEVRREEGDKQYRMSLRRLTPSGRAPGLPPLWRRLRDELTSPSYRETLSTIVRKDLSTCEQEVVVWRYGPGCHLSAHPDEPTKVFTHILYLNEGWKRSWGGALRLLGPAGGSHVEVEPALDRAVGILRTEESWHEVVPVTCRSAPDRMSVQVVFLA
jgi:hypothetical protein